MAFLPVSTATASSSGVSVTSMVVTLSTYSAGDLLIIAFIVRNDSSITPPTGFTLLGTAQSPGAVGSFRIYTKTADGSEGASVTFTIGSSTFAAHCRTVSATKPFNPPEAAFKNSGGTPGSSVDSPALGPSWGDQDTLWISFMGTTAEAIALTVYPTNYIDGVYTSQSAGGSSVSLGSCYRNLNAVSEDPGAYTTDASRWWAAGTVGVKIQAQGIGTPGNVLTYGQVGDGMGRSEGWT